MFNITDDDGRDWVAISYNWTTAEFVWIPADTEVIIAPVPGTEPVEEEAGQLELPEGS